MVDGNPDGTSRALTIDAAASAFEGLLSRKEKSEPEPQQEAPEQSEELEQDAPETPNEDEGEQPEPEGDEPEVEEDPDEQPPEPRKYKVKANGEDLEVTEDELLKGYSRTQDYTRKTQELSEKRKAQEAEFEAVKTERQKYATYLSQLEETLDSQYQEPDWDKLRQENPEQFPDVWAQWQQYSKKRTAIADERRKAEEKVMADMLQQRQSQLDTEKSKLLEAVPTWSDAEVAKKESAEIAEYAKSIGFSDADISAVYDHRLILILRDALAHRRAVKAKPAVQKKIEQVRVTQPGSSVKKPAATELTRAKQRLAKTGRLDDAAAAFEQMI